MLNPHAPAFTPSKPQPVAQVYTGSFLKPLRPSRGSKQFREGQSLSNPVSVSSSTSYGGEPPMNSVGYGEPTMNGSAPYVRQQHLGHQQYGRQSATPHSMSLPSDQANSRSAVSSDPLTNSFQELSLAPPPAGVAPPPPTRATALSVASSALRLPPAGSATTTQPSAPPKQQVCKYYLMGECKIINCGFLHTAETQSAVCRYWQWGECRRGDHCRFLHRNIDPAPPRNSASASASSSQLSASAVPLSQHLRPQQRQRLLPTSSASSVGDGHFRGNDFQPFDVNHAFPPFQSSASTVQAPRAAAALNSNSTSIPGAIPFSSLASLSSDFLSPTALTRSQSSPADVQPASSVPSAASHDIIDGKPKTSQSNSSSPNSAPAPPRSLFQFSDSVLGGTGASLSWSPNPGPTKSSWPALSNASAGQVAADATPPLSLSTGSGVATTPPDLSSSALFPAIGSAPTFEPSQGEATRNEALAQQQPFSSYMDLASRFKLEDLQRRHFPHVDANIVEATFKSHACNFKGTERTLLTRFGAIPASMKAGVQPGPKLPAAIPHPSLNYTKNSPFVKENPWLTTGNEVGILYEQYRSDAVDHALQRNAMFQKAADAYLRGDGKLAREFSDRGHFHDEAMHAGHAKAARVIFDSRNTNNKVSPDGHLTLDFHGLHRTEAAHILEEKLTELTTTATSRGGGRSRGGTRVTTVDLVLGTGHHSTGGKPILLPAVLEFLSSHKYAHREVSHGGRGGVVRVMLDRSVNNTS